MHSIQIDENVFAELARCATGFNVTPNDVLRRVLNLESAGPSQSSTTHAEASQPVSSGPGPQTLTEFVRSDRYQRHHQSVDRFLVILGRLHSTHPKQFADAVLGFQRGKRTYFAKSEKEILEAGEGVTARPIPQSPFWALTTLDNRAKRLVLEDIL